MQSMNTEIDRSILMIKTHLENVINPYIKNSLQIDSANMSAENANVYFKLNEYILEHTCACNKVIKKMEKLKEKKKEPKSKKTKNGNN